MLVPGDVHDYIPTWRFLTTVYSCVGKETMAIYFLDFLLKLAAAVCFSNAIPVLKFAMRFSFCTNYKIESDVCSSITYFLSYRYLKRGVNEKGRVANDVETEQIVFEDVPNGLPMQISSVVQNRGSIPLFWSQETSRLNIKPDIIRKSGISPCIIYSNYMSLSNLFTDMCFFQCQRRTRTTKPLDCTLRILSKDMETLLLF